MLQLPWARGYRRPWPPIRRIFADANSGTVPLLLRSSPSDLALSFSLGIPLFRLTSVFLRSVGLFSINQAVFFFVNPPPLSHLAVYQLHQFSLLETMLAAKQLFSIDALSAFFTVGSAQARSGCSRTGIVQDGDTCNSFSSCEGVSTCVISLKT